MAMVSARGQAETGLRVAPPTVTGAAPSRGSRKYM